MKLGSSNSNDFKQFLNSYMTLPAATNPNTIHMRKFADGADEVTRSLRDKTAGHQSSGLIGTENSSVSEHRTAVQGFLGWIFSTVSYGTAHIRSDSGKRRITWLPSVAWSLMDLARTAPVCRSITGYKLDRWFSVTIFQLVNASDCINLQSKICSERFESLKPTPIFNVLFGAILRPTIAGIFSLTVTYGLASYLFLAVRVLKQLADDHLQEYPGSASAFTHDAYVEDIPTEGDWRTFGIKG